MTPGSPRHPAPWSRQHLPVIRSWLDGLSPILDPMAGIGRLSLPGLVCSELEPEWAVQCPRPALAADAHCLPFRAATFAAAVTSVTYGSRMADHHNATERCSACAATGQVTAYRVAGVDVLGPCPACGGKGTRDHHRNTYRHQLGRPLHRANTGAMQWGDRYRDAHVAILQELWRVLRPGAPFLLNVSNHLRGNVEQDVVGWYRRHMADVGWTLERRAAVRTPRQRDGANRDKRVDHEWLLLWRRG